MNSSAAPDPIEPDDDGSWTDGGPLGMLPRLSGRRVRLEQRLGGLPRALEWLKDALGADLAIGGAEVLWRPSGLKRSGLVAQLSWPQFATRLALGLETPLAHVLVDRMLGYERPEEATRLQLTPVEWGILTFAVARSLRSLEAELSSLGPWDLVIDRVGPDPFDATDLGGLVTLRWSVRVGSLTASARLWIPESLVNLWLDTPAPALSPSVPPRGERFDRLSTQWTAEAGVLILPRGIGRLRPGAVVPLTDITVRGTPQNLAGTVSLTASFSDRGERCWFPAEPVPFSQGGRLTIAAPLQRELKPREAIAVSPNPEPAAGAPPADVPVTVVIELGRVNLSLSRLADLKPGDVVELGRHSRAPVELTSGGRLVARGELVQIDTELGVRLTHVFL